MKWMSERMNDVHKCKVYKEEIFVFNRNLLQKSCLNAAYILKVPYIAKPNRVRENVPHKLASEVLFSEFCVSLYTSLTLN